MRIWRKWWQCPSSDLLPKCDGTSPDGWYGIRNYWLLLRSEETAYTRSIDKSARIDRDPTVDDGSKPPAATPELVDEELLCVFDGPPLLDCDGTVEGSELPALLVIFPSARRTTYISPVESEDMKSLPELSHASPTGRKQPSGQTLLLAFETMSIAAVELFAGSSGSPLANSTKDNL